MSFILGPQHQGYWASYAHISFCIPMQSRAYQLLAKGVKGAGFASLPNICAGIALACLLRFSLCILRHCRTMQRKSQGHANMQHQVKHTLCTVYLCNKRERAFVYCATTVCRVRGYRRLLCDYVCLYSYICFGSVIFVCVYIFSLLCPSSSKRNQIIVQPLMV